jgi:hypothetical protein
MHETGPLAVLGSWFSVLFSLFVLRLLYRRGG